MARNKYPEITINKILSASERLFSEKGFEKTSIADIIKELGMSKGAIYHHFSSKEDILKAVLERKYRSNTLTMLNLLNSDNNLTAKENLTKALEHMANDQEIRKMDSLVSTQIADPHYILMGMKRTLSEDAPIISKVLQDGIKDLSFDTSYPDEAAEVLMILLSIWINPIIFERNREETIKRIKFLQYLAKKIEIDVISDKMIDVIDQMYTNINGYTEK